MRAKNLLSESAKLWREKCINTVIPNNEKVIKLLQSNEHLIPVEKLTILDQFISHVEGLKDNYNSEYKDRNVPLFPKEIITILY